MKCYWCKKEIPMIAPPQTIVYSDQECERESAEQYAQDNFRDIAYMMGTRIVEQDTRYEKFGFIFIQG